MKDLIYKSKNDLNQLYRRNKKEFMYELKEMIQNYITEEVITSLKLIEFGINKFNDSEIYNLIIEFRELVKSLSRMKRDIYNNYIEEIEIINLIYQSFYDNEMNKEIEDFINKYSVFNFLNLIEKKNITPVKISRKIQKRSLSKSFFSKISIYRLVFQIQKHKNLELLHFTLSDLLKYYISRNFDSFPIEFKFSKLKASYIYRLLELMCLYLKMLDVSLMFWKLNGMKILRLENGYYFKIINKETLLVEVAGLKLYQLQENQMYNEKIFIAKSNLLPPENFISHNEYCSYLELINAFYDRKLEVNILGLTIKEWLRAYSALGLYLSKRTSFHKMLSQNYLYTKSKEYWINIFKKYGFTVEKSKIILKYLTFNKKSEDFYDSPFFQCEKGLACMPSVTSLIKPSRSILALISKNNQSVIEKGEFFEEYIYDFLNKNNVKFVKVHKDSYQCDLVFIIKQELFICELKNNFTAHSTYKYFETIFKYEEDVKQLDRINKYFCDNFNFIEEAFAKKYDIIKKDLSKLKKQKMVLYGSIISKNLMINNIFVVDIINFRDYFNDYSEKENNLSEYLKFNRRFNFLVEDCEIVTETLNFKINGLKVKVKFDGVIDLEKQKQIELVNKKISKNSNKEEVLKRYIKLKTTELTMEELSKNLFYK